MRRYLALLPLVAACADEPAPPPMPALPQIFEFHMQSREMTYADCVAGSEGCTYIRLDYPTVVEAPVGAAVEAVTEAIDSFLEAPLRPDEPRTSVNALMARFLSEFAAFQAAEPKSEPIWFLERKAFVLRNAPNLVSLSFSERSYLGGAHGIATIHYLNLDPQTGVRKALTDILREGAVPELTLLAESRFREVREIPEGTSLEEAGFTFEDGVFVLSDNFALRDDGLAFYYNPYDVGPYAMGATEILLGPDEVRGFLKPEYAATPSQSGATAAPQREQ